MNNTKQNPGKPKAAPMYLNEVRLIGFVGDAPKLHENRANFSIATKTSWPVKDADTWQEETHWHRAVAWGLQAEVARTLDKGDHVLIEGELRSHSYHKEVGVGVDVVSVPITSWEIRIRAIRKLERAKKTAQPEEAAA
jgi:single stranded DNA-binding protein